MFKTYLLILTILFTIVGCGNNKNKVYEEFDLVSYLESTDMIKNFKYQGGDIRSSYSYFDQNIIDTIISSENQIIHNLVYSIDSKKYTHKIHFNQNTIFNLDEIPSQSRYKFLKKELKSENTLTEDLIEFINGIQSKVGTSTVTKKSTCIYLKTKNIQLDKVEYEGDYLQYQCKLINVTQYKIDSDSLNKYPQLSDKDRKYDIEEILITKIYEKNIGLIQKDIVSKINIDYCKHTNCTLFETYTSTQYLLK